MTKRVLLIIVVLFTTWQSAFAYDFSAVAPSGQTLYYRIYNGKAVVTYPGSSYHSEYYSGYTEPSGNLIIPASVTFNGTTYTVISIDNDAFFGCHGLTSVTIDNSVAYIGSYSFSNCIGLTSVTIPNSVISIGSGAFSYVRHIEYHGTATGSPWGAISLNGVTEGDFVYSDETKQYLLAYVGAGGLAVIPSSVQTIGARAFWRCTSLTSVIIGNSVTSIGSEAFYNCDSLTSVTIGTAVTSIGDNAFQWCFSLTSVIVQPLIPPTLGGSNFTSSSSFFVPCGSLYDYQHVESWTNFSSNIEESPFLDFNYSFVSNDTMMGTVSMDMADCDSNVVVSATANAGFRFMRWSDGNVSASRTFHLTGETHLEAFFVPVDTVYVHDTTVVHDTTYVNVPFAVHDTTIVRDTVTLTEYVPVHDTTYIDVYVYDTTIVTDTVTLTEYVPVHDTTYIDVHDTTYINLPVYDTTIVTDTVTLTEYVPVHDTTYIDVHDTTYIDVFVHDTTVVTDTVTLTEYVPVHDTTYIDVHDTTYIDVFVHDTTVLTDTVTLTEYVPVHDTTYIDVHDTTYISVPVHDTTIVTDTVMMTEYVPVHDTTYIDVFVHDTTVVTDMVTQFDTITNTVYDTIDRFVYDTVFLTDTIWLHDTIYIHDTVYITQEGIDGAEALNAKVYSSQGQIVIEGAGGNAVTLFDVNGRLLATKQDYGTEIRFDALASGTYMIKIGSYPARKVVVIR